MAHAFDTGLSAAQRTLVRNAIVSKLQPLLKSNGKYLTAIKKLPRRYRGEGDEDGSAMLENALRGQEPAVAVALGRKTYDPADLEAFRSRGELTFSIYVVCAHQRDTVVGRLELDVVGAASDTADPGLDIMLEHIEERLLGQELGVSGVAEMRPVEEDEILTVDNASVWEQVYTVQLERVINPNRAGDELITSIQGDHALDGIPDGHALDPLLTTIADLEEPEDP